MKTTAVDQPTATAAAAGRPGAKQIRQETTIQLKYVTGKMSSDYLTIHGVNSLKFIFGRSPVPGTDRDMRRFSNLVRK